MREQFPIWAIGETKTLTNLTKEAENAREKREAERA
jgi:hypothetical protein